LHLVGSEVKCLARPKNTFLNWLAVNVSAVRRAKVPDADGPVLHRHFAVVRGNGRIINLKIVVCVAADAEHAGRQFDLRSLIWPRF
jgi:hypothetical protein